MTNAPAIPGPVDAPAPLFIVLNISSGTDDAVKTREIIEGVLTEAGREHRLQVVADATRLHDIARQMVEAARARGGVVVAAGVLLGCAAGSNGIPATVAEKDEAAFNAGKLALGPGAPLALDLPGHPLRLHLNIGPDL